jgi:hypothetical protein
MTKYILIIFTFVLFSCENANLSNNDAGTDIDIVEDATDIIDADLDGDADGDIDGGDKTPLDDPYEVNVTCSSDTSVVKGEVRAYGAKYPYIYWISVYYQNSTYYYPVYKHNVETGESTLIDTLPFQPTTTSLVSTINGFYLFGTEIFQHQEEPFFSYIPYFYHLDTVNDVVEEIEITYPLESPHCAERSGKVALLDYNYESGWMIIRCRYTIEQNQYSPNYDFYRLNINTGEYQHLVNGEDEIFKGNYGAYENQNTNYLISWGEEWGENWSSSNRIKLGIWELSDSTVIRVVDRIWESREVGIGSNVSSDAWYYFTALDDSSTLQVYGTNILTNEKVEIPESLKHKFGPAPMGKTVPHLVSYATGSDEVDSGAGTLQPKYIDQIQIWDKTSGLIRQATIYSDHYVGIAFIPEASQTRYLIYNVAVSPWMTCIFYKDLIAAGILDATGHLIPESTTDGSK